MKNKIIKLPKMETRADFQPKTFNENNNTVEVIFSVGAKVRRFSFFDGPFDQELAMDPKNVRLERLNNGAPLLNNHRGESLDDVIGVVENAMVDGKKGIATVRFSERPEVQGIVNDVKNGILKNISVGFRIHKNEKVETKNDVDLFRATDWEPLELSLVTVPADRKAQVRNEENETFDCEIINAQRGNEQMENKNETEVIEAPEAKEVKKEIEVREIEKIVVDEEATKKAVEAERVRINEIRSVAKVGKLDEADVEKFIKEEKTVDEVRKFIVDKMAVEDQKTGTRNVNIEITSDEKEVRSQGLENALLHRSGCVDVDGKAFKLDDNGKQYRGLTLVRMANLVLSRSGVDTSMMTNDEIAKRALHTSSDFPEILANVANKSLRGAYEAAPQTFMPFTRMTTVSDFKEISRTQFGEGEKLSQVNEHGEFERGTISEGAEKYSLKTFGKIYGVTRQAIVNDDMGAFSRLPAIAGQRARDLESDTVWGIIIANALLSDGIALFDAAHGNLGAAAAISVDELGKGRAAMRKQVGLDGQKLNIKPMWLYVPASLESKAEQFIAQTSPNAVGDVNPFGPQGRSSLMLGVEPRLDDDSATAWYMMASLGQLDMIEAARLQGSEGPVLETRNGFEVDGVELKVRHDFAAKALDFRGLYKNPGA